MPSAPSREKTPSPSDRAHADERGAGRSGERAVGDRVRDEGGAAQHDEEADRPGDHRDDARRDPGVQHTAGEHRYRLLARDLERRTVVAATPLRRRADGEP